MSSNNATKPTNKASPEFTLQELKRIKALECAIAYYLDTTLHTPPLSANEEHSQKLVRLIAIARGYMDEWMRLTCPGLADTDLVAKCEQVKQELVPVAASFSSVMQKVHSIVSYEWLPPDDPVEYLDSVEPKNNSDAT